MTNKPKTNKGVEEKIREFDEKFPCLVKPVGYVFEKNGKKKEVEAMTYEKDNVIAFLKKTITQTQQETLEWCLKKLETTTVWERQIAQNRNGMDYCATCEQAYEDCSCPARNSGRNRVIQEMRQIIKKRMEEGK